MSVCRQQINREYTFGSVISPERFRADCEKFRINRKVEIFTRLFTVFRAICWVCHETYCSSWIMWIRGFVSTAYCGDCRSSSGGSVDLLSRTIFTTLIVVSRTLLMVGGFRSKPFQQNETAVQFFWSWLRMWSLECSLIIYSTIQKVY